MLPGYPMAVTISVERRRLLRLLARGPNGRPEALLMAYGFSIKFLADMVFDGLATAELSSTRAGSREVIVVLMQITEKGRRAIAAD
jgi:hypothetical protein